MRETGLRATCDAPPAVSMKVGILLSMEVNPQSTVTLYTAGTPPPYELILCTQSNPRVQSAGCSPRTQADIRGHGEIGTHRSASASPPRQSGRWLTRIKVCDGNNCVQRP